MALDVASLTLDDSQASLASMPEELWRKIGGYLTPATTARAFVVAGGRSSSLQNALRAEIEQTERAMFGMTRREAEELLVDDIRSLDNWARDERFVRYQVMAGGDTEEIMERVKEFASSIMALHISTRAFLCRRGEPPPDAAADEPEGGLEAYARHFM